MWGGGRGLSEYDISKRKLFGSKQSKTVLMQFTTCDMFPFGLKNPPHGISMKIQKYYVPKSLSLGPSS